MLWAQASTSLCTHIEDITITSKVIKVVDFGTNRKRVYDFLLVLNSNLGPRLPRFSDIKAFVRWNPLFRYPPYSGQNFRVLSLEQIHGVEICRERTP